MANVRSINFHELDDSTEMIFVETHQISVPNAYKTIQIKIAMKHFLDESNEIQTIVQNASKLCQHKKTCRTIRNNIQQFQNNLQKLIHSRRFKRAASLIQPIYDIFGDSNALSQQALDELQAVHIANKNITAEHIRINSDTIQLHKDILVEFTDEMKMLTGHLLEVESDHRMLKLESSINELRQIVSKGNEEIKNIVNILNGETAQIIDIIGYSDLHTKFKEIKQTLHDNEHLLADHVIDIIASADIRTRFIEDAIHIDIKIPIGYVDDYHSYRIIPMPFIQDNNMKRIKSSGFQIVHSKRSNETFTISENNLNHCKQLRKHDNRLICTADKLSNEHVACEIAIFANKKPSSCEYEQITAQSRIIQIPINTFYIVTRNTSNLEITCNDITQTYQIERSSWFQLESGCLLQSADERFRVPYEDIFKTIEIVMPKNKIPDFDKVLNGNHNEHSNLLPSFIDTAVIGAKFNNIASRLSLLLQRNTENNSIQLTEKRYYQPYLWLLIIIFCLLMICSPAIVCVYNRFLFVCRIFKCSKK